MKDDFYGFAYSNINRFFKYGTLIYGPKYGVTIQTFITPFGRLDIILHPLLKHNWMDMVEPISVPPRSINI